MVPADSFDDAAATLARTSLPFVTPPAWAEAMRPHVAELLVEQAHLEKKAAAAAITFLFRLPHGVEMHRGLSVLAREELVHFERTLRLLQQRGITFLPQAPSAYAERLKAKVARTMPERLVDELLVAAIIEARSCERMGLLAAALRAVDAEVASFYADLCEAEARHESVYLQLAIQLTSAAVVARRLGELGQHEATVLRELPLSQHLHSGCSGGCAEAAVGH